MRRKLIRKHMGLKLFLGPMKSGKSAELIRYFSNLNSREYALFQSALNVRDENIRSRNGQSIEAKKIHSLSEIDPAGIQVIGIDELHMFSEDDYGHIKNLTESGLEVLAAGLYRDYKDEVFGIVKKLIEMEDSSAVFLKARCETCLDPEAEHIQVLKNGIPALEGLPSVLPEDGTYEYRPVCKKCFIKKQ